MTTTFSEPPRDFGASDDASSRYARQLAALEQQSQSRAQETQSWRLMAFIMTGVSALAIAASLYVASLQPTPVVLVVEIDSETGETVLYDAAWSARQKESWPGPNLPEKTAAAARYLHGCPYQPFPSFPPP